jgi:hypothetical protein
MNSSSSSTPSGSDSGIPPLDKCEYKWNGTAWEKVACNCSSGKQAPSNLSSLGQGSYVGELAYLSCVVGMP